MMNINVFGFSLLFSCVALNACAKTENATEHTLDNKETATEVVFVNRKALSGTHDIDGDGKNDVVEVVNISENLQALPSSIILVTPWAPTSEDSEKPHQFKTGSDNNVLVTLGNSKQFLMHDKNEISILDTEAAQEINVTRKSELGTLDLPELSAQAKGDVIVVPTEAGIDTYLFWNGNAFQSYEPLELP